MEFNFEEGTLSEIRLEMVEALNTFLAHVKYTITLMVTLIASAIAIPAFAIENHQSLVSCYFGVSMLIFLLQSSLSYLSIKICRRYYVIYASTYIYYARVHIATSSIPNHPWVVDLIRKQQIPEEMINSDDAMDIFIEGKYSKDKNSWYYYRWIIYILGCIGVIGALLCGYASFIGFSTKT